MPDFDRLTARGTSIAHCPLSNAYFSAKPFPLREALDQSVQVGLGTDIAGGYSLDIMNAMRQAVSVSRMREGERQMAPDQAETANRSIDWKESLFLATRGGALCLGLPGMFRVGAPFDAQESECWRSCCICLPSKLAFDLAVRLYDPASGQGVGPLDYFDLEADLFGSAEQQSMADLPLSLKLIEKWWCAGDTRNRGAVWVQGNTIRIS